MATIAEIVDFLKEVSDADPQIGTFLYDKMQVMNEQRDKQYPILLVDSSPEVDLDIAGKQRYRFRLHFFAPYQRDEQGKITEQDKQGELLLVAQAYLREVRNRGAVTFKTRSVALVSNQPYENRAFFAKDVFNDMLIQLSVTVEFLTISSCPAVDFDYSNIPNA